MKKFLLVFLLISGTTTNAQYWPIHNFGGQWIRIKVNPNPQPDAYRWEVSGGISMTELNQVGLLDMGSGRSGYGYYEFMGESESSLSGPVLDFPPSLMDHNYLITYPYPNKFISPQFGESGFCNCDCVAPTPDTAFPADAFGFWIEDPNYPWNIWGINEGYAEWTTHMDIGMKLPCPPTTGFWKGVDPLSFTDSLYKDLPDGAVLSGDSPLYIKATLVPQYLDTILTAIVYLESSRQDSIIDTMTYIDSLDEWHGKIKSSRDVLKLKSYSMAVARCNAGGLMDTTHSTDRVAVALPKILLGTDSVLTDTVFIRSDSMIVAKDPKVYLCFYDDAKHTKVLGISSVDSAGYKYKSRWIANSHVPYDTTVHPDTLFRQFPANTNAYRWWNKSADSCKVAFKHDSLYAVGGKLSIESKGALNPLAGKDTLINIDNRFTVTTDSLIPGHPDSIKTKMILIDKDPANSIFIDSLKYDIIRAIAWVEYAGSNDQTHCHQDRAGGKYYNPQFNNYWDTFVSTLGDTCRDSLSPCENIASSATGTMQFIRRWGNTFKDTLYWPREDRKYYKASWDSTAWNWRINIIDGTFIFLTDNYNYMWKDSAQATWDSVCLDCPEDDSVPQFPNKEDLSSYGYYLGGPQMKYVTDLNWCKTMMADTYQAKYVRKVRGSKYAKPWNQ